MKKLNDKFGIENNLKFSMKNKLMCAEISNEYANATVYLHGAHVASFRPGGERDVLWMSKHSYFEKKRPIRGGIPICWPWFGSHPAESDYPSHGVARIHEWNVIGTEMLNDGRTMIQFELPPQDAIHRMWPYDFRLRYSVTVGKQLEIELITKNIDNEPFTITSALHSYFNISNISDIEISGLEKKNFIDTVDSWNRKTQTGRIIFDSEVDRVYLGTADKCVISDFGYERKINVAKKGSKSTVVWNPWIAKSHRMSDFGDNEYKTMVCVETTNALSDAVTIAPGKTHKLKAEIGVCS